MLPQVFSHVAEFNEAGYQSIPALAFIADPLILWSPSGSQIASAKKNDLSVLGPEDLLTLVRKRFIRIHGREEWLTSKKHREIQWKKTAWPHARWSDFDDGICEIVEEDLAKPTSEKRIFFAEPDGGGDWADAQQEMATEAAIAVDDLVKDAATRAKLPPGTCEKIARASDGRAAARAVLRDIHNHAAAFSEARAISVEPPAFAPLISELAKDVVDSRDSRPPRPSSLEETLELFNALMEERDAPVDLSELEELLSLRAQDPRIEMEVGSLLVEKSSARWLDAQIASDSSRRLGLRQRFFDFYRECFRRARRACVDPRRRLITPAPWSHFSLLMGGTRLPIDRLGRCKKSSRHFSCAFAEPKFDPNLVLTPLGPYSPSSLERSTPIKLARRANVGGPPLRCA